MNLNDFLPWIGFLLAAYSVIGNDSVQTLGTFIASNSDRFKWYTLWAASASVLVVILVYGWVSTGGDISFGRLNSIPHIQVQWYHACVPLILFFLTRMGIPVSTSFLVLSAFAPAFILEKMLIKSALGYSISAVLAYVLWLGITKLIDEEVEPVEDKHKRAWRVMQWLSTGFLWAMWLSHDVANIAVFLPRLLSMTDLIIITTVLTGMLGYIFWDKGGKIQQIVMNKTGTGYVRSATLIDLVYAAILLYFKNYSDIPMSTTWVFVGLLSGRELAIATFHRGKKVENVFPIIGKDFLKMMIGLGISVVIVVAVQAFN